MGIDNAGEPIVAAPFPGTELTAINRLWFRNIVVQSSGCSHSKKKYGNTDDRDSHKLQLAFEGIVIHGDKKNELEKMSRLYSDIQIENFIKSIMETRSLMQRNINQTLALEVLMLKDLSGNLTSIQASS